MRRKRSRRRTRARSSGERLGPGWRKAGRVPPERYFILGCLPLGCEDLGSSGEVEVEGRSLAVQVLATTHADHLIRSVSAGRRTTNEILGVTHTMRLISVGVAVDVSMIDNLAHSQDCDRDDRP